MRITRHYQVKVSFTEQVNHFVDPEEFRNTVKENFAASQNIDEGDCYVHAEEVCKSLDAHDVMLEELSRIENTLEKALEERGMSAYAVILESIHDRMSELLFETYEDYDMTDSIPGKVKHIGGCRWYSNWTRGSFLKAPEYTETENLDRHEEYYLSKEGRKWVFWMVEKFHGYDDDKLYRLIETSDYYYPYGSEQALAEEMLQAYYGEAGETFWLNFPHEPGRASGGDILSSERIQDIHYCSFDEFLFLGAEPCKRVYPTCEGDTDGESHDSNSSNGDD